MFQGEPESDPGKNDANKEEPKTTNQVSQDLEMETPKESVSGDYD